MVREHGEGERVVPLTEQVTVQLTDADIRNERLAAMGRLVSGIAHEINNPLCSIGNEIQLLLLDEDKLPPEAVASLRNAWSQVDRIDRIVRSFLTFARNDPPRRATVRLQEVVQDVLGLVAGHRDYRNLDLRVEGVTDLPPVSGDPVQLGQVLLNLISNARDAMDGRGRVRIRGSSSSGWIELEVADEGPGIPESIRDKVFDPMFSTKEVGKGTGLGLTICHEVARRHGGTMALECPPSGGTVMRLRLPACRVSRPDHD